MGFVVRGAEVIDGTGAAGFVADVAVEGDRIAAIGAVGHPAGVEEIDGRGLVLAPGFIDVHTHDDFAVLLEPRMPFKVMQGVTTDIIGNCGFGPTPFAAAARMALTAFHPGAEVASWDSLASYFTAVDRARPAVNVAALVGHGTLRMAAVGLEERAATADEAARMRGHLEEGIEAGAVGLSSGLIYRPGRAASTEELVELARVLAGTGAVYATHMRNEGDGLLEAVAEAIYIGEIAGVPVQISHHKASGRSAWGRVRDSIGLIDEARARGVAVHADQYPYTAGSTTFLAVLDNSTAGGGLGQLDASAIRFASTPGHPEWEGLTLAELSTELGLAVEDASARVAAEEGAAAIAIIESMCEDDVRTVLQHPVTMIGSDGIPSAGKPHPRLYGTFPRVLGRYVREQAVIPLAEAVHRMTGLPATVFGLADRGAVTEGSFADLVLFDPHVIADRGTYDDPTQFPAGLHGVWVNGEAVARDGVATGARPGRALRRGVA